MSAVEPVEGARRRAIERCAGEGDPFCVS